MTHPEQARQSVRDIWAGAVEPWVGCCPSRMTSCSSGEEPWGSVEGGGGGRVSTGLMQATPGVMKSFRSSAERIADILGLIFFPLGGRGRGLMRARACLYMEGGCHTAESLFFSRLSVSYAIV